MNHRFTIRKKGLRDQQPLLKLLNNNLHNQLKKRGRKILNLIKHIMQGGGQMKVKKEHGLLAVLIKKMSKPKKQRL